VADRPGGHARPLGELSDPHPPTIALDLDARDKVYRAA
jgi:hypothetical protein